MYADLCVQLHTFFVEHPLDTDPKGTAFKKILLNECQLSFERDLAPPKDMLETLSGEDRTIGEMAYKRRMLGTIKFVGNLLTRRMLASKVTIAVAEELLADPTCEALESLATLLTVVGPVFDAPEWPYHLALKAIFDRVSGLSKQSSVDTRARCLLKDVLDLRAAEWTDRKPKKVEGPKKLAEVAAEEGCQKSPSKGQGSGADNGWTQVGNTRNGTRAPETPTRTSKIMAIVTRPEAGAQRSQKKTTAPAGPALKRPFDRAIFRAETHKVLMELRVSHDAQDAIARISEVSCPPSQQPTELCELLTNVVQEGSSAARRAGIQMLVGLFLDGHWRPLSLVDGIKTFRTEVYEDLRCDVPTLPKILRDEVHPCFEPLMKKGLLSAEQCEVLFSEI
eukprot:gnl/TRDRNA2_/TRDRNA2_167601_c2_seq1.p2 gnl/TRDRNA2_/TRDRNA2_167601_c2~~gnl/TRDRNA2_/TRDRNA2_167601_c2_seq1.p2  ORF type:complete len:393 (+),score=82.34 gnl/TRDRNA2_/TRDRNA2_167601_c2_seq1:771-1949(+)